ncbi:hypothetical protein OH491_26480 [Termitidicoccus mucosus]|uniref:Uncharacterized protein n=1 Tax=Termitidicoccus mucosus TaxID=1184151 RepID=A0A178ILW2_9BACT|nr:hypothetical protein AW736_00055 [Opitutaceae bacterium TSB47]
MKPEDLIDPASLPEELQWVSSHYRLHPDDPVYLLIAWHWQRVKASEDILQAAIVEMKTALDARIEVLADSADAIAGVNAVLNQMQQEMVNRPAIFGKELETQLRQPVTNAVERLRAMEKVLGLAARTFRVARRRHLLATLLTGVALGAIGAIVLFRA